MANLFIFNALGDNSNKDNNSNNHLDSHLEIVNGELVNLHVDKFDENTSIESTYLQTDNNLVKVENQEIEVNNQVAASVENNNTEILGTIETGKVKANLGNKKLAVVLINFTDDLSMPYTHSQIRNSILDSQSSAVNYYKELSNNQINFTGNNYANGDVYGWYTMPFNKNVCSNYSTFVTTIQNVVTNQTYNNNGNANINVNNYDNVMFVFPYNNYCSWAGLAYMPGKYSFINGTLNTSVTAHELGHNLGVNHASSHTCYNNGRTFISNSCNTSEYGDPFDVMGNLSTRLQSNWHMQQLGIITDTTTVYNSGNYNLSSTMFGTNKIVRIPRVANNQPITADTTYLYLDLRNNYGVFDNYNINENNGVNIRLVDDPDKLTNSKLLDANFNTTTFNDSSLQVDQSVIDSQYGIKIKLNSINNNIANLDITLDHAITAPILNAPILNYQVNNNLVNLSWTVESNVNYTLKKNGEVVGKNNSGSHQDSINSTNYYQIIARDEFNNYVESNIVIANPIISNNSNNNSNNSSNNNSNNKSTNNNKKSTNKIAIISNKNIALKAVKGKKNIYKIQIKNIKIKRLILKQNNKVLKTSKTSTLNYKFNNKTYKLEILNSKYEKTIKTLKKKGNKINVK